METYNLNATNKEKESNTINNYYTTINDTSFLNKFTPVDNKTNIDWKNIRKTKWAKFTYFGKETKFITKLFNNSNLKSASTTQNTICKLLFKQNNYHQNKFKKCGVYQLTCPDCNKKYIGQTG
jgi:hypothetical protein